MPRLIEDYGPIKGIETFIETYNNSTDVSFDFNNSIKELLLPKRNQLSVYRVIRETVTGAVKHAAFSRVSIQMYHAGSTQFITIGDSF